MGCSSDMSAVDTHGLPHAACCTRVMPPLSVCLYLVCHALVSAVVATHGCALPVHASYPAHRVHDARRRTARKNTTATPHQTQAHNSTRRNKATRHSVRYVYLHQLIIRIKIQLCTCMVTCHTHVLVPSHTHAEQASHIHKTHTSLTMQFLL